ALINPDDSRKPKRLIPGSPRFTNDESPPRSPCADLRTHQGEIGARWNLALPGMGCAQTIATSRPMVQNLLVTTQPESWRPIRPAAWTAEENRAGYFVVLKTCTAPLFR